MFGEGQAKKLRWFLLPSEAKRILCSGSSIAAKPPFQPLEYPDDQKLLKSVGDVGSYGGGRYSAEGQILELISSLRLRHPRSHEVAAKTKNGEKESEGHRASAENGTTTCDDAGQGNATCDAGQCVLPNGGSDRGPARALAVPKGGGWRSPPASLFRPFLEAAEEFKMIGDGDRVLVCLSGGKDSLSLLHTLRQYKFYAKNALGVDFRLGACTVDPLSSAYDPRPLIPYLASLGVQYLYEEQPIMAQALAAGR